MADKVNYVSGTEQDRVSRGLLAWLNQCPDKPVKKIEFEFLDTGTSMSLSTVTAAYKVDEDIGGDYTAQYQFAIFYRIQPSFSSDRLAAVEALDTLGRWAEERSDKPILGEHMTVIAIERNSTAAMIARYDDGTEDFQILMTMNYEVNNNG